MAGDRAGDRLDDLAGLLPAGDRGDLDERPIRGPGRRRGGGPGSLAPIAGGSPEADALALDGDGAGEVEVVTGRGAWLDEVTFIAVLFAAACVLFGIFPSPLFNLVAYAGRALFGMF